MSENFTPDSSLQQQMETFEETCRTADLKLTHQRLEIYRELAKATDHPSAEMLHKRLQKTMPTLSLDTVYRTLTTFEQHHLVKKVQTVDSQARFEAQMVQHHHLICDSCKEIMDFHWNSFDSTPLPADIRQWGTIRNKNVTIHGTCQKCQALKKVKKRT
ncbi:MAG: Fur family transcriptional regulator [Desulfocapsaceae bacterium]|nr:Fur family transcriptional regulator [Desulfocapsaceae bacterium]